MMINNPPQANFTINPQKPMVGDLIKFDASVSYDKEDSKSLAYHWEINNNSSIFSVVSPPKQEFDEKGMFWINLTVTDKNGAKGYKNFQLKINQPPIPRIAFDSANLSLGKMINFSAAMSEDPDGEIVSYAWDFGDNSVIDFNKTVLHSYREGGEKTVRLSVSDSDGAINDSSRNIVINRPPIAKFSIDPLQAKKGELVSFNASASYDSDGKIQRYLWDFGVGRAEPDVYYSEFAEHTYSRPNKYDITLTVEDDKGATGSFGQSLEVNGISKINDEPIIKTIQSDKINPQVAGSIITWTASASDTEIDPMQFQFTLDGQVVQDWSDSPTWSWTATEAQVGSHVVAVKVRDGKHNPDGDATSSANFEIILPPNDAPVMSSLTADKAHPGEVGYMKSDFSITSFAPRPEPAEKLAISDLKEIIGMRVEPANPLVHTESIALAARYPGDYSIEQVSGIYDYLSANWRYVSDPRGLDSFNYANESLRIGKLAGGIGAGDCDDFAILMSSLIESIGGTTRIILSYNNSTGGHAFAEAYLGCLESDENNIYEIIEWLKIKYNVSQIYAHMDAQTEDVWLNLDWGADNNGNAHPGGPFFQGDKYILISNRDWIRKTSMKIPA